MRVDVHCHVSQCRRPCQADNRFTFEPAGERSRCDAYLSEHISSGIRMRLARWFFDLPRGASVEETDAALERAMLEHILGARLVDRVVVLAFDEYHTVDGQPLGPRRWAERIGTDMYVSNTYVRQLWRRHPQRILFGASIHPYRRRGSMTAVDMLDEVAAAGAVLIKWLPLAQNINMGDPRTMAFLRHAGEMGMPMLIHFGDEKALGKMHPEYQDPTALLWALRRLREENRMPTVIVAHAATPSFWPITPGRTFRILTDALLGEFADAPLYTDISALALFNKAHWLKRLIKTRSIHRKLVYGSDFPVPPTTLAFALRVGWRFWDIEAMPSSIDRDVAIKAAAGIGEDVFTRGSVLLGQRIAAADAIAARFDNTAGPAYVGKPVSV